MITFTFSETLVEALPQFVILFIIGIDLIIEKESDLIEDLFDDRICIFEVCLKSGRHTLFGITFLSSLFSVSIGMTKFLKHGPCRILPNQGVLRGYLTWNFCITFVNVVFSVAGNAIIFVQAINHSYLYAMVIVVKFIYVSETTNVIYHI